MASNQPDLSILGDQPEHLREASAAAAERIRKQMEEKAEDKAERASDEDPKGREEYTFSLKHRDGRGKIWKGTFTNRVPNVRTQQAIALLQSEWQFGKTWHSLDPDVVAMNNFLAHMAFSLTPHEDARWARNDEGKLELRDLYDPGIIQALWLEVASHEATFLGRGPNPAGSQEDS